MNWGEHQTTLLSILKDHADRSDKPEIKEFFKSGATKEDWEKAVSEAEIIKF